MSAECVFEESVVAVEAVVAVDVEDLEAVFLAVVIDFLVVAFFFLVDFLAGRLLISEAMCRDFRSHDEDELAKLVEWQKLIKSKSANKEKPVRPDVAFWFPPADSNIRG